MDFNERGSRKDRRHYLLAIWIAFKTISSRNPSSGGIGTVEFFDIKDEFCAHAKAYGKSIKADALAQGLQAIGPRRSADVLPFRDKCPFDVVLAGQDIALPLRRSRSWKGDEWAIAVRDLGGPESLVPLWSPDPDKRSSVAIKIGRGLAKLLEKELQVVSRIATAEGRGDDVRITIGPFPGLPAIIPLPSLSTVTPSPPDSIRQSRFETVELRRRLDSADRQVPLHFRPTGPTWRDLADSTLYEPYPFQRGPANLLAEHGAVLLNGPSRSGRTTLLRQIGFDLHQVDQARPVYLLNMRRQQDVNTLLALATEESQKVLLIDNLTKGATPLVTRLLAQITNDGSRKTLCVAATSADELDVPNAHRIALHADWPMSCTLKKLKSFARLVRVGRESHWHAEMNKDIDIARMSLDVVRLHGELTHDTIVAELSRRIAALPNVGGAAPVNTYVLLSALTQFGITVSQKYLLEVVGMSPAHLSGLTDCGDFELVDLPQLGIQAGSAAFSHMVAVNYWPSLLHSKLHVTHRRLRAELDEAADHYRRISILLRDYCQTTFDDGPQYWEILNHLVTEYASSLDRLVERSVFPEARSDVASVFSRAPLAMTAKFVAQLTAQSVPRLAGSPNLLDINYLGPKREPGHRPLPGLIARCHFKTWMHKARPVMDDEVIGLLLPFGSLFPQEVYQVADALTTVLARSHPDARRLLMWSIGWADPQTLAIATANALPEWRPTFESCSPSIDTAVDLLSLCAAICHPSAMSLPGKERVVSILSEIGDRLRSVVERLGRSNPQLGRLAKGLVWCFRAACPLHASAEPLDPVFDEYLRELLQPGVSDVVGAVRFIIEHTYYNDLTPGSWLPPSLRHVWNVSICGPGCAAFIQNIDQAFSKTFGEPLLASRCACQLEILRRAGRHFPAFFQTLFSGQSAELCAHGCAALEFAKARGQSVLPWEDRLNSHQSVEEWRRSRTAKEAMRTIVSYCRNTAYSVDRSFWLHL